MMEKKDLRKIIRERKKAYTKEQLDSMSVDICKGLMMDGAWRAAGIVLLYHALPDEVSTDMLIHSAEMMDKVILLPVVVGDDLELRIYEGPSSLKVGAYGIMEPVGPIFPESEYDRIDLAIIPGMAFDPYGNRLGRGKGYYDRLLPRLGNALRIGVCFPFQKVDSVPSEAHDIKVNDVVC